MNKDSGRPLKKIMAVALALALVFTLTPQMANADTAVANGQVNKTMAVSPASSQMTQAASEQKSIQRGAGQYDGGAGIYCTTHKSGSTYAYTAGRQVYVEADCTDYNYWGYYRAYFGIWDKAKEEYLQVYESDYIYDAEETWYVTFDTSKLVVSSGRYQVQIILYDELYDVVEAADVFNLTVKAVGTPSITSIAPAGPHSATLSWGSVPAASGYRVYRASSSNGTYTSVGTTSKTTLTCTGMTTGHRYYYKVKAFNNDGSQARFGNYSSYRSVVPRPLKTTGLTATTLSYNSVRTSWEPVSGATGYQVYKCTTSGGTYTYCGKTSNTAKAITGLTTGKTYYFKVRAYHTESSGKSYFGSFSNIKSAKPGLPTPTVSTELDTYNSIWVSWNKVTGASGYEVLRYDASSGAYTTVKTISSGSTVSFLDSGLELGVTYRYKVRAFAVVSGVQVYSVLQSAGVAETTVDTPDVLALSEVAGTISVYWGSVPNADGYLVLRRDSTMPEGEFDQIADVTALYDLSYFDEGCVAGVDYTYQVKAYIMENGAQIQGEGGLSQTVTAN